MFWLIKLTVQELLDEVWLIWFSFSQVLELYAIIQGFKGDLLSFRVIYLPSCGLVNENSTPVPVDSVFSCVFFLGYSGSWRSLKLRRYCDQVDRHLGGSLHLKSCKFSLSSEVVAAFLFTIQALERFVMQGRLESFEMQSIRKSYCSHSYVCLQHR